MANYPPPTLNCFYPPTYHWPVHGTEVHIYKDKTACTQYPHCKGSIEYEHQFFCGRCGQRLDWFRFEDAKEVYIEWSGPKDDDEEDDEIN